MIRISHICRVYTSKDDTLNIATTQMMTTTREVRDNRLVLVMLAKLRRLMNYINRFILL